MLTGRRDERDDVMNGKTYYRDVEKIKTSFCHNVSLVGSRRVGRRDGTFGNSKSTVMTLEVINIYMAIL